MASVFPPVSWLCTASLPSHGWLHLATPRPPPLSLGSARGEVWWTSIPLSHFQLVLSHYKSFLNPLVFIAQFPFSNKTPSDVNLEFIERSILRFLPMLSKWTLHHKETGMYTSGLPRCLECIYLFVCLLLNLFLHFSLWGDITMGHIGDQTIFQSISPVAPCLVDFRQCLTDQELTLLAGKPGKSVPEGLL